MYPTISSGEEHLVHPKLFKVRYMASQNYTTGQNYNVSFPLFFQSLNDFREQGQMVPRKKTQTDDIHVFLNGSANYLVHGLPETCVYDFHTRILQCPGNNFGAAIMAVKSNLCN